MNTSVPILHELNNRKSVRLFAPKPIEQEKLDALWAAAQWAPSSSNKQEWHYYAVLGGSVAGLAEVLMRGNHWALKAPLVIGVTRDTSIHNTIESRDYGAYDVALSVMCLVIEAEHQGLRSHQMAGFSDQAFRAFFSLPENEAPVVVVAVGYEGDPNDPSVDPAVLEKEQRPRERKPLTRVVSML